MNRREALCGMLAGIAGAGTVKAVGREPEPLVMVITLSGYVSEDYVSTLRHEWDLLFEGAPPCPLLILPEGATLEARTDPRG